MIHLLPLSVAGGLLAYLAQQRQQSPPLVERLVVTENELISSPKGGSLLARVEQITIEEHLALSVGLLGMTAVGHLGVPLLRLVSLPGLVYLDLYFVRNAYHEWQAKRQIGIAISDGVLATGLLVTGQWGADALFATLFFASRKLQAQAEKNLAHALAVEHLFEDDSANGPQPIDRLGSASSTDPSQLVVSDAPTWHVWIDQGSLPFLFLGAVSVPLLGIQRALSILLANFGYDYRLMAPLGTLSYLTASKAQGLLLRNGQVLEKLLQLDTLVLDGMWETSTIAFLQSRTEIEIISLHGISNVLPAPNGVEPDLAAMIGQLQAAGRVVAYLSSNSVNELAATQADIFISTDCGNRPDADLILAGDPIEKLQICFAMIPAIVDNRKRGLYYALMPSLINLGGIYFLHFGVITALLVDYVGSAAGLLNVLIPRFQKWSVAKHPEIQLTDAMFEQAQKILRTEDNVHQWHG